MRDRVRAVIAEVLGMDAEQLPEEPSAGSLEAWDSLHHMELMVVLEERFGVEVPPEMLPELVSLSRISDFLSARVGAEAQAS
jgi:acyl carrier protein